jgi:hypothetical protein
MRLPTVVVRSTRRLLPLLAATLLVAVLTSPVAAQAAGTPSSAEPILVAQETTPSSTTAPGQAADSSTTTSGAPGQGGQSAPTAIVPPPAAQVALNPGWSTDQMDVRVWSEYDAKAVLVIMNFSLPADVPLPATLKFPMPAGAQIAGIGEIDPTGGFTYNYANSYPSVEPGDEWDIATIDVTNYRQLQIDYYYDPGLPQEAGPRSFPLLVQMPVDAGMVLLHVQHPARATDFAIQPALQGTGQAEDGFTYSVATYNEVKAGSTLGHLISYYKPDGGLSIDSDQSTPTQFNTTTVLLAAILVIVVIVGALVIYRLYSNSRGGNQKGGGPGAKRGSASTARSGGTKRQRQAEKAQNAPPTEPPKTTDPAVERGDAAAEYCIACGEELDPESPFCPSCGEARP